MLDTQKMRDSMVRMSVRELQELYRRAAHNGWNEHAEIIHQSICARLDDLEECDGSDDLDTCVSHCTFDDDCRCDMCSG